MFLTVNGQRLHIVLMGSGSKTILAVGGWTGSWELWEEPLTVLSTKGWRAIAFDHRGSGESPVAPASISVQSMVDDLVGVLDQLEISSCVLAGESSGGAIAQIAAVQYPDRFSGLVLIDSASTQRLPIGSNSLAAACKENYPEAVKAFIYKCLPDPGWDHVRRWGFNLLMRAEPEQAVRLIEMWQEADVPVIDVSQIRQPTLIIHGTEDLIVPIETSRKLNQAISQSRLIEISGAGHVPTMTHSDEVVAAISDHFG